MRRLRAVVMAAAAAVLTGAANAHLTQAELEQVGVTQRVGARLPLDARLQQTQGEPRPLSTLFGGKPAILAFTDYTCQTSCGVALQALLNRLAGAELRAGREYRLIVVGIDPNDGPAEAQAFRREQLEGYRLAAAADFTLGGPADIKRLLSAAGVRIAYDAERDQYAHPAIAVLADPAGRIARYLDPLAASALDLRLALADSGGTAALSDRLLLLCYGWDPATGIYTPLISRILVAGGLTTVAGIALVLFGLMRLDRRRTAAIAERRQ